MDQKMNPSIGCNVTECRHNCADKQHCSLDKIYISDGSKAARKCKDTLCDSFQCKNGEC